MEEMDLDSFKVHPSPLPSYFDFLNSIQQRSTVESCCGEFSQLCCCVVVLGLAVDVVVV